jgi:predicted deacylase/environmental stress-induced protein Ves
MAWKNGLGQSVEIAVVPPGCDFAVTPFLWRVSLSEVVASTTFSLFHGYDRIMLRLDGDQEVKLKHNFAAKAETHPIFTPHKFKGEWHTESLVTGQAKVVDMFIILDRTLVKAAVKALEVLEGVPILHTAAHKGTTLIYSYNGTVDITSGDLVTPKAEGETADASPSRYTVKAGETFEMSTFDDNKIQLQIDAHPGSAGKVVIITLMPRVEVDVEFDSAETYDSSAVWKIWNVDEEEHSAPPPKLKSKPPPSLRMQRSSSILFEHTGSAQVYTPPKLRTRFEAEVPPPIVADCLVLDDFPKGEVRTAWINMVRSPLGEWIRVPVLVARGLEDGPTLGLTAAVHGNELNGVPCIHKIINTIDVHSLKGTVVGVPCVNVAGYLRMQRGWSDGVDLNRHFPGKERGLSSEVFCHAVINRLVKGNLDYLIDLHTASFGRINSYYVRADLNDPDAKSLATLIHPQIILHDAGQDGTLRGAATRLGVKAITVEIGNPQLLQNQFIQWTSSGILNVLDHFKMYSRPQEEEDVPTSPIVCKKGYWTYTTNGGILEVYPGVNTLIKKGDVVARMRNIFGNFVEEYFAEEDSIVIGRSSNPVASTGDRILHLGVIHDPSEPLPQAGHENY